jgi:hypothetical protein
MSRGLLQTSLLALVVFAGISPAHAARLPAVAEVVAVQPVATADLILLSQGYDAGLRQGMVCRLARGSSEVAEVLLVDLRPSCSAALILNVAARQAIRPGDVATIKVSKS